MQHRSDPDLRYDGKLSVDQALSGFFRKAAFRKHDMIQILC